MAGQKQPKFNLLTMRPAPRPAQPAGCTQNMAYGTVSRLSPKGMPSQQDKAPNAPTESLYAIRTGTECAARAGDR